MTAPVAIRRLNAADTDFARHLDHLLSWESVSDDGVNQRVLEIIQALAKRSKGNIVGMDLVEVAPAYDPAGVTSILAAQLLMNSIGFIALHKKDSFKRASRAVPMTAAAMIP